VAHWLAANSLPALASEDGAEVALFLDQHVKNGDTFASWAAAWRTWKAGWVRFNRRTMGPAPGHGPREASSGFLPPLDPGPRDPRIPQLEVAPANAEEFAAFMKKTMGGFGDPSALDASADRMADEGAR
jgi:hypothetical protein